MTKAKPPIENKAYVANYDPTRVAHRKWLLAVLDAVAANNPKALQDGGALRNLWLAGGDVPDVAANLFDSLRPLLDIIGQGEGSYIAINKGKANDTPEGYPGLDRLTLAQVQQLQKSGYSAVGRYQFIASTLSIAIRDAGAKPTDIFNEEMQDWLAVCLLLGSKRPILADYLTGKSVALATAQDELAKEWASIPGSNGRGYYDGDKAGNRASAQMGQVRAALEKSRAALTGKKLPKLQLPAQQKPPLTQKIPAHLRLTRTKRMNSDGLELLRLERVKDGVPMAEMMVVSGAPGRQVFRRGADSKSGSLEPLPEGLWKIENIAWKNGRDNYVGSWGEGLGPASVPLVYMEPGTTKRSAIEMHFDANHAYSPGTAGCIGLSTIADLKKLIAWLRMDNPRALFVNYGLGSCPPVRPV